MIGGNYMQSRELIKIFESLTMENKENKKPITLSSVLQLPYKLPSTQAHKWKIED